MGRDLPLTHPDVVAGKDFHGPNQWPDALPGFTAFMTAYFESMQALCTAMHEAFCIDLDLPSGFFDDKVDRPLASEVAQLPIGPMPKKKPHGSFVAGTQSSNVERGLPFDCQDVSVRLLLQHRFE